MRKEKTLNFQSIFLRIIGRRKRRKYFLRIINRTMNWNSKKNLWMKLNRNFQSIIIHFGQNSGLLITNWIECKWIEPLTFDAINITMNIAIIITIIIIIFTKLFFLGLRIMNFFLLLKSSRIIMMSWYALVWYH